MISLAMETGKCDLEDFDAFVLSDGDMVTALLSSLGRFSEVHSVVLVKEAAHRYVDILSLMIA